MCERVSIFFLVRLSVGESVVVGVECVLYPLLVKKLGKDEDVGL